MYVFKNTYYIHVCTFANITIVVLLCLLFCSATNMADDQSHTNKRKRIELWISLIN